MTIRTRKRLLASAALALVACSDRPPAGSRTQVVDGRAAPTPRYVGTVYDPLPPKVTKAGGALVQHADGADIAQYSLAYVDTPTGARIWLDSTISHKPMSWKVVAELELPSLQKDEQTVYGLCSRNGRLDESIVAIVLYEDKEHFRTIRHAWTARLRAHRFEALPVSGISCSNEGYGAQ